VSLGCAKEEQSELTLDFNAFTSRLWRGCFEKRQAYQMTAAVLSELAGEVIDYN
jgi:hypothetical protein